MNPHIGKTARRVLAVAVVSAVVLGAPRADSYFMNRPDGALEHLKEGTFQIDLGPYRTKLDATYLDRRWVAAKGFALANEFFFFGQTGIDDYVRYALPVAHKAAFQWITNQEQYWFARDNLSHTFNGAHLGINMVQGPYWTLKALEFADKSKIGLRDRGERVPSNKDTMLQYIFPYAWKRIGLPRLQDDGAASYLMFESGDPHLMAAPIVSDTFFDPQSLKRGKWGVPEYFWNRRYARWNQDSQVRFINMGGEGMQMKRMSMWISYMWKATHAGRSPSSQGYVEDAARVASRQLGYEDEISFIGNDVEEGFKGLGLASTAVNKLLAWKSQLVADEAGNLGGIDPFKYDPAKGLRYWPHRIWPNMLLGGDLPERQWSFDIADPRSLLFDQAAMLLGAREFYINPIRLREIFTPNPPNDGGIFERDLGVVARGVANMVVQNLQAMHTRNGLLVSEWQPKETKWWVRFTGGGGSLAYDLPEDRYGNGRNTEWLRQPRPGPGDTFSMRDAAYAIKGLFEYVDIMRNPMGNPGDPEHPDVEPKLTKQALALLTAQADFLVKVQGEDGSWCERYNVVTGACVGERQVSEPQFWGIAAMTSAYHANGREWDGSNKQKAERYMEAARKAWNHVWTVYWHEPTGLFRTRVGDDTVFVTSASAAAQEWAYREMIFNNPAHLVEPLIDYYTRWFIQTVEMTNLQQAEQNREGELCHGACSRDFDNDGIPWMGKGPGTYGIAPVFGTTVAVNLGGPGNKKFLELDGERVDTDAWGGKVVYGYKPQNQPKLPLLPVKLGVTYDADGFPQAPWVQRPNATRFDGVTYPVPPAIPFKRGSNLTGQQIVEMNCAHCHGYSGEGITGIPWDADSLRRTRDDMFEVPKNGRFTRIMPEWGRGLSDDMGSVLTDEEIYRIVDYVQSPEFRQKVYEDYSLVVHPDTPPKDVYFYISLSYVHGKRTPANSDDIRLIMDTQARAVREKKPIALMPLLLAAEKGRSEEASDPYNGAQWLWRILTGRGNDHEMPHAYDAAPYKTYPTFFDLLHYQAADSNGVPVQYHNVRELATANAVVHPQAINEALLSGATASNARFFPSETDGATMLADVKTPKKEVNQGALQR